jgi:hypothetical protein
MVGDIAAPRVIIVDGASFRGRIDMGEVDVGGERRVQGATARAAAPARPALRPSAPSRAPQRGEAKKAEVAVQPSRPSGPPAPVAMGSVKRKVIVKTKK